MNIKIPAKTYRIVAKKEGLMDLDACVLNGLEFLSRQKLQSIDAQDSRIVVIGSGNAEVAGKIIFKGRDATFADEGNYIEELTKAGRGTCCVISASGGKHSPAICKYAKEHGFKVVLLTNTPKSLAEAYADKTIVFGKMEEPYTYNFTTYMGMILGQTKEDPKLILNNIKKMEKKIPKNLGKYKSFFFIIPSRFDFMKEMLRTKFDELFGPKIGVRLYTMEQTKHAKTIVSDDKELFISVGEKNKVFGKNKLNIDFDEDLSYANFIASMYFMIGKIQRANKPYFKDNIDKYVKQSSKIFGQKIDSIVR